jgi:HK97 gp10 family phage protein
MAKTSASLTFTVDTTKLRQLIATQPQRVSDFLDAEAEDMVNDIKLSFGTSPSSPGEPPGVDTGTLRNSIGWVAQGAEARRIQDGVEYGVYLEFGTENMRPRPFMGPAFERKRQNFAAHAKAWGIVI